MDTILARQSSSFYRFKRGKGVTKKQFEFFIDNLRAVGFTGWYEDSERNIADLKIAPRVIIERTVEKYP